MAFLSGWNGGWEERSPRRPLYEYVRFSMENPDCIHVVLSTRAYNGIIAETLSHDRTETGGALIGHIFKRVWYVTEVIPPGLEARRTWDFFHMDVDFVNFMTEKTGNVYAIRPTILGFWHRHPGSMDVFSGQDFESIRENERGSRYGVLTMLVNIDPRLRMTFYHARHGKLMKLHYDQGDEYVPPELLELATPQQLIERRTSREGGADLAIAPNRTLRPEQLPRHIVFRKAPARQPAAPVPPREDSVPAAAPAAPAVTAHVPDPAPAPASPVPVSAEPVSAAPAAAAPVSAAPAAAEPAAAEPVPAAPVPTDPAPVQDPLLAGREPADPGEAFDLEKQYALLCGRIAELGCRLAVDRAETGDPAMETTETWLKRYLRLIEDSRPEGRVPDAVAMERLAVYVCDRAVEGEIIADFFPTGEQLRRLMDAPEGASGSPVKEEQADD